MRVWARPWHCREPIGAQWHDPVSSGACQGCDENSRAMPSDAGRGRGSWERGTNFQSRGMIPPSRDACQRASFAYMRL